MLFSDVCLFCYFFILFFLIIDFLLLLFCFLLGVFVGFWGVLLGRLLMWLVGELCMVDVELTNASVKEPKARENKSIDRQSVDVEVSDSRACHGSVDTITHSMYTPS